LGHCLQGIGFLGFGTVGYGAYTIMKEKKQTIADRTGVNLVPIRALVRDMKKSRSVDPDCLEFSTDINTITNDSNIHIVIEAMGGVSPAFEYISACLLSGKHVVTANKEVMAKHGKEIHLLAEQCGRLVFFEACVGGGIPIIQTLETCLHGNDFSRFAGIINGTTNYILTKMEQENSDFSNALKDAQVLGYAESDPTADVDGFDTLYKVVLLCEVMFGVYVDWMDIPRKGIQQIRKSDMEFAKTHEYRIKLIGMAEQNSDGIFARVEPMMLPKSHPLTAVNDVYNGIMVTGDHVGDLIQIGRGAGSFPTGSAVVNDVIRVANHSASLSKRQQRSTKLSVSSGKRTRPIPYYLHWNHYADPALFPLRIKEMILSVMEHPTDGMFFITHRINEDEIMWLSAHLDNLQERDSSLLVMPMDVF